METIDLRKQYKSAYTAKSLPQIVEIPPLNYLAISGKGNPDAKEFKDAIEALYPVVYKLKFMIKQGKTKLDPFDFKIMPLEGQWYAEDYSKFTMDNKSEWLWNAMIAIPANIPLDIVEQVITIVKEKKDLPALDKIKLEQHSDGLSVQLLYIGAYDDEPPTIEMMHRFAFDQGYKLTGRHREIYLSDARKTPESKLKTIIRQPIQR